MYHFSSIEWNEEWYKLFNHVTHYLIFSKGLFERNGLDFEFLKEKYRGDIAYWFDCYNL